MKKQPTFYQRMTMPLPALEEYHRQRRKEDFEQGTLFKGIRLRKCLHPVMVYGLKLMHLLFRQRITILGDKRTPAQRPIVYAATHIGWDDIEMILTTIKDHAYLLLGDPHDLYRNLDGMLLNLNGIICCDTGVKEDRHISKESCIQWLTRGGNILIFPEGAWNITPSLPVMKLFTGAAEMAIRAGADIVPVAIEQCGKDYIVNIGRNMDCFSFSLADERVLTEKLRNEMATLRWEIWSSQPTIRRSDIPADYRKKYLLDIEQQMGGNYTIEEIETTRFRGKDEIAQRDAFAHLEQLQPCRENAFLYNKRLHGHDSGIMSGT